MVAAEREKVYVGVVITLLAAMALSLVFAARRSTPRLLVAVGVVRKEPSRAEVLLRAIADLDVEFERAASDVPAARASYEARRGALKAELAEVLAASRP